MDDALTLHEVGLVWVADELRSIRAAMKEQKAREAELADTLKVALEAGIEVPGAKLAEAAPKLKWAPNALGTARGLSPDLVREELVPTSSIEPELLDRCKELGLVQTEQPAPRLILEKN